MKRRSFLQLIIGFGIFIAIFVFLTYCKKSNLSNTLTVVSDSITIPTYIVDPPNTMPRFYEGQAHQGVQRRMYPYPFNDNMTNVKKDLKYHIIYMENEFIKVGIMPGLGGRIYSAVDKSNGYDFFYKNNVIKPSLIGMIGYWISGGNAWGFPHHHGPNTVEPMDYTIEKHQDGSATVWMSYIENFHRMRILCGFTMHPNSSVIDMKIRPFNPTPYVHSFLFWSNPSVHADTTYQVIFPPSVEFVTQHHKNEMTTWPVADSRYNYYDYTGKDISMWKNTGVPSSFFSWKPQEDFFGGYDHGKRAGTAWIGNHYTMPGMKYWADGNNAAGRMINDGLTDNDGQYIELMAGAFTDNQPDYSWLQPYESKNVTMSWYPIRELGGLIEANKNAALNLEYSENGKIVIKLNATRLFKNAFLVLTSNDKIILKEKINISPSNPYSKELSLDEAVQKEKLSVTLYDSKDEVVLHYRPKKPSINEKPEGLQSPPIPEKVKTIEELYLHGLRLDQFHNASISSYPYYEEALKRDPCDYRINTQLGITYLKRKMFEQAEKHLQTAVARITMRYTRPKDSDALYYLGIAKRRLNKNKEAYQLFYDASWNAGWYSPAFYQLAELDCQNSEFEKALEHINRAISGNTENVKAQSLKISILRKLGRLDEAEKLANEIIENDALYYHPRNELILIHSQNNHTKKANDNLRKLDIMMQDKIQSYLEFATEYSNCGLYKEAVEILSRIENKGELFPMLYYYLGYYWSLLNDKKKAAEYFNIARQKPHNYCFPFRDESVDALNEALKYNPDDAMAYYYLGNLFYEIQPDVAILMWEKSLELNDDFYIVQRNLALAAQKQQKNLSQSVKLYAEAFANNSKDERLLYEYDVTLQEAGVSPSERFEKVFLNNREVAKKRTSTLLRELELLIFLKNYDEVADILNTTEFIESEGSRTLRDLYHNTYILKSMEAAKNGNYKTAIENVRLALDYPIGRWGSERRAQMYFLLGTYLDSSGNQTEAEENYKKAVDEITDGSEYSYYKGLALIKLGKSELAFKQFNSLLNIANKWKGNDAFRSFEGGFGLRTRQAHNHYIRGLAYNGLGRKNEALNQFRLALTFDPSNLWANYMLNN